MTTGWRQARLVSVGDLKIRPGGSEAGNGQIALSLPDPGLHSWCPGGFNAKASASGEAWACVDAMANRSTSERPSQSPRAVGPNEPFR